MGTPNPLEKTNFTLLIKKGLFSENIGFKVKKRIF